MFMFLKVFFILLDCNNVAVSSAKILLISELNSSIDPGKIQHSLSLFYFWVRRETVRHAEDDFNFFVDATSIE